MESYPKFQFSRFINDKDQVVVRSDSEEEFKKLVNFIYNLYPNEPQSQNPPSVTNERFCQTHRVPLERRWSNKKNKEYWAHGVGNNMCFGR